MGSDLVDTGVVRTHEPKTWGGHSGLLIEWVKHEKYFLYFAHFVAKNGGSVFCFVNKKFIESKN